MGINIIMGYDTEYAGELKFKRDLTGPELSRLKLILDNKVNYKGENFWINLEILEDFSGLEWNGNEKTYPLDEAVTALIEEMQEHVPDFDLEGEMTAQGEMIGDLWKFTVKESKAVRITVLIDGDIIKCPCCDHEFVINEKGAVANYGKATPLQGEE